MSYLRPGGVAAAVCLVLGVARAEHGDSLVHAHENQCEVAVRQIFPLGGPFNGNTAVTVSGPSFRDMGDVKCRFGIDEVQAQLLTATTQRWVMNPRGRAFPDVPVEENTTVLECSSPGCRSPTCLPSATELEVVVPLEISMNGITFTGAPAQATSHTTAHSSSTLCWRPPWRQGAGCSLPTTTSARCR